MLPFDLRVKITKELSQPAAAFVAHPDLDAYGAGTSTTVPSIAWHAVSGRPLPFCGHASLAASVVLQTLYPSLDKFSFAYPKVKAQPDGTKVSVDEILAVAKAEDGRICIDAIASIAPKSLTEPETEIVKIELREGAGIEASDILYLGKSLAKDLVLVDLLVVLSPTFDLAGMKPKFPRLAQIPFHGIWMTNRSNRYGETFRTRAFFPSYDLPEDQVCGTAHTLIGPYWATQQPDLVNTLLESNQVSPRRGRIGVRWDGEWAVGTCQLFGTGRICAQGKLYV